MEQASGRKPWASFSGIQACFPAWYSLETSASAPSFPVPPHTTLVHCPASLLPDGRAPRKNGHPEPAAGYPAALPGGQSCRGGGGADGRQGQCLRQAEVKGRLGNPKSMGQGPREGTLSFMASFQALQLELSRAQEAGRRRQQQTAMAEEQLKLVANAVSRYLDGGEVG